VVIGGREFPPLVAIDSTEDGISAMLNCLEMIVRSSDDLLFRPDELAALISSISIPLPVEETTIELMPPEEAEIVGKQETKESTETVNRIDTDIEPLQQ
jgi:hypothetical protein